MSSHIGRPFNKQSSSRARHFSITDPTSDTIGTSLLTACTIPKQSDSISIISLSCVFDQLSASFIAMTSAISGEQPPVVPLLISKATFYSWRYTRRCTIVVLISPDSRIVPFRIFDLYIVHLNFLFRKKPVNYHLIF